MGSFKIKFRKGYIGFGSGEVRLCLFQLWFAQGQVAVLNGAACGLFQNLELILGNRLLPLFQL